MKVTLLYPPIDDPTMPYHGNAYLVGSLRANGLNDASARDINIEFVDYCLEPQNVERFYQERERKLARFATLSELSFAEQSQFFALWQHKPISSAELAHAAACLRCKERFLDYEQYLTSVNRICQYFALLGNLSFPGEIYNFQQHARGRYSIYTLEDLFDTALSDSLCFCFAQFFHDRLANDPELERTDIFGVSIIYDYQLVPALWLARALKTRWPDRRVVLGGTALSQTYKYMKIKANMVRFFDMCDAIVVGEGETAMYGLATCPGPWDRSAAIVNTITFDRVTNDLCFPDHVHYEKLPTFGPPIYDFPWHLYLSPERGINYSPTRGCYWNRCTFCDYGLNTDRPTSPWRERSIEQVVCDLKEVLEKHQIQNVYFAVDVMAPGYLERLSEAIIEAGLKFRWSAELRMEKIFSPDRCDKMVQAGCVCASFGMESGNQRILNLIDKGTNIVYMEQTMRNFAQAGVAVQLMTFAGFPTETKEEKLATIDFIERNREYWAIGGLGTFLLTGTAIVARKPELFGITLIENDRIDIARSVEYFVEGAEDREAMFTDEYDASFDEDGGIFPSALGRPWAGGIDSLHSMIYYAAHGTDFFKKNDLRLRRKEPAPGSKPPFDMDAVLDLDARLEYSNFDLTKIAKIRKLVRTHFRKRTGGKANVITYRDFMKRDYGLSEVLPAEGSHWVFDGAKGVKIDPTTYQLLKRAVDAPVTARELLSTTKGDARLRLEAYLRKMYEGGILRLKHNAVQEVVSC